MREVVLTLLKPAVLTSQTLVNSFSGCLWLLFCVLMFGIGLAFITLGSLKIQFSLAEACKLVLVLLKPAVLASQTFVNALSGCLLLRCRVQSFAPHVLHHNVNMRS